MKQILANLFSVLRIPQYIKNLLVIAAPFGAAIPPSFENLSIIVRTFVCFCLASSLGYVINDWHDRNEDRFHENKKNRPFASKKLGRVHLYLLILILGSTTTLLSSTINREFQAVIILYLTISILYSYTLKLIPVVELVIVTFGFLLRALAGALAFRVDVSQWFLIVVGFSSLFLVGVKRLAEYDKYKGNATRSVITSYSERFLTTVVIVSISISILGYSLWIFEAFTDNTFGKMTILTVLVALLRFLWHSEKADGEKPENVILSDTLIPVMGLITFSLLALAIY